MIKLDWISELDTAIQLELGYAVSENVDRQSYAEIAFGAGLAWMRQLNETIYCGGTNDNDWRTHNYDQ